MAERSYLPVFMDRCKNYHTKVRKPPGGDTNDIFDLEKRQKERKVVVYEDKSMKNAAASDNKVQLQYYETEDMSSPYTVRKPRRSLSECRINSDDPMIRTPQLVGRKPRRSSSECRVKSDDLMMRTPPLAVGKENIGSHFKKIVSLDLISSEGKTVDESEDEIDDENVTSNEQKTRNPITGDGLETDTSSRIKLEDNTNVAKNENLECKAPRRPCIRIRQPPGGASSIVF